MTNPLPPPPLLPQTLQGAPVILRYFQHVEIQLSQRVKNIQNLCWMDKIDCLVKLCNKTIVGITISAQTVLFNYFFYV